MDSIKDISEIIIQTLNDLKAKDIKSINVTKLSNVTDFMILATPRSARNSVAIANKLIENTKPFTLFKPILTKDSTASWMIIDYHDLIVHLMLKEIREFYKLENLWDINNIPDIKTSDA